jgi:hypothetical protein
MKKLLALLLLVSLVWFVGCDEEDGGNGDEDAETVEGPIDPAEGAPTKEALVDTFIEAANNRDKDVFYSCFNTASNADPVWERIEKYDLTFSEGYTIEEGSMYDTVIFDSARWEDFQVYEQELYVGNWNAEGQEIDGWLFNGQGWHYPEGYLEDEAADEEVAEDEAADEEAVDEEAADEEATQ